MERAVDRSRPTSRPRHRAIRLPQMSRNTARGRDRIVRVLLVTYERWGRLIKCAFLVPIMTVVFLGLTMWSGRASEPDPGELVSMLDHAAIVETMALACKDSRPDLAAPFREARQHWWVRNASIQECPSSEILGQRSG